MPLSSSSFNILAFLFESLPSLSKENLIQAIFNDSTWLQKQDVGMQGHLLDVLRAFPEEVLGYYVKNPKMKNFLASLREMDIRELIEEYQDLFLETWRMGVAQGIARMISPVDMGIKFLKKISSIENSSLPKEEYGRTLLELPEALRDVGLSKDFLKGPLLNVSGEEKEMLLDKHTLTTVLEAWLKTVDEHGKRPLTVTDLYSRKVAGQGEQTSMNYAVLSPDGEKVKLVDSDEEVEITAQALDTITSGEVTYSFKWRELGNENSTEDQLVVAVSIDTGLVTTARVRIDGVTTVFNRQGFIDDYEDEMNALSNGLSNVPESVHRMVRAQGIEID